MNKCLSSRSAVLILIVSLSLAGTGCSGYKPPSIQLVGVRLVEQTDEAAAFHFDLELTNPNHESIELREFQYDLRLDDSKVYHGRRAATTTLHPGTVNRISLPTVVRYDTMGWSNQTLPATVQYRLAGSLLYVTPGELAEILLDTGVKKPSAGFRRAGNLDLPSN